MDEDSALKTKALWFHNGKITMFITDHTNKPYKMPVIILFSLIKLNLRYIIKNKIAQHMAMAKCMSKPVMFNITGLVIVSFPNTTLEIYCKTVAGAVPRFI